MYDSIHDKIVTSTYMLVNVHVCTLGYLLQAFNGIIIYIYITSNTSLHVKDKGTGTCLPVVVNVHEFRKYLHVSVLISRPAFIQYYNAHSCGIFLH